MIDVIMLIPTLTKERPIGNKEFLLGVTKYALQNV